MGQTAIGVLLVVICTLLEGVGQVFLKKSVLGVVRWYLWISFGVVILLIEKMIYSEALLFLDVGAACAIRKPQPDFGYDHVPLSPSRKGD